MPTYRLPEPFPTISHPQNLHLLPYPKLALRSEQLNVLIRQYLADDAIHLCATRCLPPDVCSVLAAAFRGKALTGFIARLSVRDPHLSAFADDRRALRIYYLAYLYTGGHITPEGETTCE